jgi:hypothetical protein
VAIVGATDRQQWRCRDPRRGDRDTRRQDQRRRSARKRQRSQGATVIDAAGRYVVPGFIDTNVHLSLYGGMRDRYETLAKYYPRENEIVLEAAQIDLTFGVTTVRDSYGFLNPLTQVRDSIASGKATGARILAAGNIVGWGGPIPCRSPRVATRYHALQAEVDDAMAQTQARRSPT